MSFTDQSVTDLLNKRAKCYVDKSHHLQGAMKVLLRTAADVVKMAAAVEWFRLPRLRAERVFLKSVGHHAERRGRPARG